MDYNVYLACKNKQIKKQIFEKGEKIIDQITTWNKKKIIFIVYRFDQVTNYR